VLTIEGLVCRYGKVEAVRELTMEARAGELVTLIGANGAGKTTTLKAISGLLAPSAGRITFLGEDITRASARRILQLGIAHCPEGRRVFPYMTVAENLEMGCYLRSDAPAITADLEAIYERFPILHQRRQQAAGTLSGGEQQMLAISRALMSGPKLVRWCWWSRTPSPRWSFPTAPTCWSRDGWHSRAPARSCSTIRTSKAPISERRRYNDYVTRSC
jgi:branched-chain amino acid transport system ATP-binding protein